MKIFCMKSNILGLKDGFMATGIFFSCYLLVTKFYTSFHLIIPKERESKIPPTGNQIGLLIMSYYFMYATCRVSHLLFVGLASFHPVSLSEIDLFPKKFAH